MDGQKRTCLSHVTLNPKALEGLPPALSALVVRRLKLLIPNGKGGGIGGASIKERIHVRTLGTLRRFLQRGFYDIKPERKESHKTLVNRFRRAAEARSDKGFLVQCERSEKYRAEAVSQRESWLCTFQKHWNAARGDSMYFAREVRWLSFLSGAFHHFLSDDAVRILGTSPAVEEARQALWFFWNGNGPSWEAEGGVVWPRRAALSAKKDKDNRKAIELAARLLGENIQHGIKDISASTSFRRRSADAVHTHGGYFWKNTGVEISYSAAQCLPTEYRRYRPAYQEYRCATFLVAGGDGRLVCVWEDNYHEIPLRAGFTGRDVRSLLSDEDSFLLCLLARLWFLGESLEGNFSDNQAKMLREKLSPVIARSL